MVTTAALRLEIDARQMKQGAAEAEKAIVSVGEGAKRTAREVKISTESIERKLDAIVEGMILHNNKLGESNMHLRKIAEGAEKSMVKAEASTQSFGREINRTSTIVETVEKKFAALGKAAVGMFAADIVAKVAGFTSAMDLLNRASQGIADSIGAGVKALRGMDDEWQRNIASAEKVAELAARARLDREGRSLVDTLKYDNLGLNEKVNLTPYLFNQEGLQAAAEVVQNAKLELTKLEGRFSNIGDTNSRTRGIGFNRESEEASVRYQARQVINEMLRNISVAASQATQEAFQRGSGGAYTVALPPGYALSGMEGDIPSNLQVFGGSGFSRSPFPSGGTSPTGQYADARRRMLAAEAEARRARMIGLSTGAGVAFGQGGIPDNRWDFGMGYTGGGNYGGSQDTMPIAARNRRDAWLYGDDTSRTDGGYIGALQNRYSPERIAEQFSANFYQSLEASVMTGDFSNFGRSVMQMIGQSLMESLVAAPIQEAMASLMQALLGGIRGGFGGGAAVGAGYTNAGQAVPPGAPLSMQSGGTSTSVAPYRSGKQRYDDLSRRNLR